MQREFFDIYLVNKKEYFDNNKMIGRAVNLPIDEDELQKVKKKIGADKDGAIFFPNARTSFDLIDSKIFDGVFYDVDILNEYAEQLLAIPVEDYEIINFLIEDYAYHDIDFALDVYKEKRFSIYNCQSMTEVASYIIKHGDICCYVEDHESFNKMIDLIDHKKFGAYLERNFSFCQLSESKFIEIYD